MTAELEAFVLFDEELYRTGHMANRWMRLLCEHFEENAQLLAPMRTGRLKAGIQSNVVALPSAKKMTGTIESSASYSLYVLGGTTGPIYSDMAWAVGGDISYALESRGTGGAVVAKKGHWLAVGNNPWPPLTPRHSVAGQAANNFMVKAWRRTSHRHSVLRGAIPEIIGHF